MARKSKTPKELEYSPEADLIDSLSMTPTEIAAHEPYAVAPLSKAEVLPAVELMERNPDLLDDEKLVTVLLRNTALDLDKARCQLTAIAPLTQEPYHYQTLAQIAKTLVETAKVLSDHNTRTKAPAQPGSNRGRPATVNINVTPSDMLKTIETLGRKKE